MMNINFKTVVGCLFLSLIYFNAQARVLSLDAYLGEFRADRPPVAVLGNDQVVNGGAVVQISGTNSFDPEGGTLEYRWSFDVIPENSNAQINSPSASSISFTADTVGAYIIKLVVNDSASNSEPAYISVRVREKNILPIAAGMWFQRKADGGAGLPALIKVGIGGHSDPDGKIVAYEYDFGDGKTVHVTEKEFGQPLTRLWHYYESAGSYQAQITVIDDKGGRATATKVVTVTDNQVPRPIFSASVAPNASNSSNYDIQLNASLATDPDGIITKYIWIVRGPDGEHSYENTSPTQSHTVTAGNEGEYKIRLEVRDNVETYKHGRASVYVGVTAPPGGSAPTGIHFASPAFGTAPLMVNFDASASFDLEGDAIETYWNFGDRASDQIGASGPRASYTYRKPGTYFTNVAVVDSHGNYSREYLAIHVKAAEDSTESAEAGPYFFALAGEESLSLRFNYLRTGLDLVPSENHSWDFGDGTRKLGGGVPYHTYAQEGTYLVTLTTVNVDGVRRKARKAITVRRDGGFPQTNVSVDSYDFVVNTPIIFDHSNSSSATGAPLKFSYFFDDGTSLFSDDKEQNVAHAFNNVISRNVAIYVEEEGRAVLRHKVINPTMGVRPTVSYSLSSRVGVAPLTVNFDASSSRDDGVIESYHWYFDEDYNKYPDQYGQGVRPSHTFNQVGTHYVRLALTDNQGNVSLRHEKVIILDALDPNNQAPVASFTSTVNGFSVRFDPQASTDIDGDILFYEWDFGDGQVHSQGEDHSIGHDFLMPGSYRVKLKVTDNDGGTHQVTKVVTISGSLL